MSFVTDRVHSPVTETEHNGARHRVKCVPVSFCFSLAKFVVDIVADKFTPCVCSVAPCLNYCDAKEGVSLVSVLM